MPQIQFSINWPSLVGSNVEKVKRLQEERGLDLLFINNVDNIRYVTGYSPLSATAFVHSGWALMARKGPSPIIFPMPFYVDHVKRAFPWIAEVRPGPANLPAAIKEMAEEYGAVKGRIGFDGYLLYSVGKEIEKLLPNAEIVSAEDVFAIARSVKSPQELAIMRRSVAIAEMGMRAAIDSCVEGAKEYEVAAAAEYAMRSEGAEGYPFMTMISSGENAGIMQELTTDKYLRRGETVLIDLGCMFEGYFSDFARTVVVGGEPGHPEQPKIYQVVLSAVRGAIEQIRPGTKCADLDASARETIRQAGYGEYEYKHFLGHGLGMTVWEYPMIGPRLSFVTTGSTEPELRPGMIVNIEPGIFKPGVGGARIEETVLVTDDGHEILTKTEYCAALLS